MNNTLILNGLGRFYLYINSYICIAIIIKEKEAMNLSKRGGAGIGGREGRCKYSTYIWIWGRGIEARSLYIALDVLDLMWNRLASNSLRFTCPCLPCATMLGSLIYFLFSYLCVCVHTHTMAHMLRPEDNLQESVFSFHRVCSRLG